MYNVQDVNLMTINHVYAMQDNKETKEERKARHRSDLKRTIEAAIQYEYYGSSDKFLKNLRYRWYGFMFFGTLNTIIFMVSLKYGHFPIFTFILMVFFFGIALFIHRLYDQCVDIIDEHDL